MSSSAITTELGKKANTTDVNTALGKKADSATMTTELAKKTNLADSIKSVSVSGVTLTFTRPNNTTFTIKTQDTNTNTSNWSVSNGTNGWARDNSTGFTIQWLQGTIGIKTDTPQNFPRTFTSVHRVVCGGIEWGGTDRSRAGYVGVESYNTSQAVIMQPSGAVAYSWLKYCLIAVGFS